MDNLPEEIIDKINDFRIGDDIHWKNKLHDVIHQSKKIDFLVFIGVLMNVIYKTSVILITIWNSILMKH